MTTKPAVTVPVESPEEKIAEAIRQIEGSAKRIRASSLTDKAVLILLSSLSGVSQGTCNQVLNAAANMGTFLKKRPEVKGFVKR